MAAGFGGVRQYHGWLIFIYKVKLKIRFDILLGRHGEFMKNVAVTFFILKSIIQVHLVLGKGFHVTRTNYSARKVAKKIKNIIKSEVRKPP